MNEDEIDLHAHDWDGDDWSPEEMQRAERAVQLESQYADAYLTNQPAEPWSQDEIRRLSEWNKKVEREAFERRHGEYYLE